MLEVWDGRDALDVLEEEFEVAIVDAVLAGGPDVIALDPLDGKDTLWLKELDVTELGEDKPRLGEPLGFKTYDNVADVCMVGNVLIESSEYAGFDTRRQERL